MDWKDRLSIDQEQYLVFDKDGKAIGEVTGKHNAYRYFERGYKVMMKKSAKKVLAVIAEEDTPSAEDTVKLHLPEERQTELPQDEGQSETIDFVPHRETSA